VPALSLEGIVAKLAAIAADEARHVQVQMFTEKRLLAEEPPPRDGQGYSRASLTLALA
jgi:hypothetical protein